MLTDSAAPNPAAIRVVVADDQELVRAGFAMILDAQPDIEVVAEATNGLEAVDRRQADLLRSFGATPLQLLLRLELPAALPQIFVALRLACSLSLLGAIAGEWFGDTQGLGVLLLQAMYNEQFVALWAAILVAGVLGASFYGFVAWAEHKIVFWKAEL